MKVLFPIFSLFLFFGFLPGEKSLNKISPNEVSVYDSLRCGNLSELSFENGEHLRYRVYYNWKAIWIKAGEADFQVSELNYGGENAFKYSATGNTYPGYNWFFKVEDKYESIVNSNSLLPLWFSRDVKEGGFEFYREYNFDRKNNTAEALFKRPGIEKESTLYQLPQCTLDLLSSIYFMRNLDVSTLKPGDNIPVTVLIDNEPYDLYVRYLGRDIKKTKFGKFNCHVIKPLLVEGSVFKGGEGMTIWVSDDFNKIPVRIEAELLVGSIKADLMLYKGIKHPFNSKL